VVPLIKTCNHCYQNESDEGESRTRNLGHSKPQTFPVGQNVGGDKLGVLFEPRHASRIRSHCYCANKIAFCKYADRNRLAYRQSVFSWL